MAAKFEGLIKKAVSNAAADAEQEVRANLDIAIEDFLLWHMSIGTTASYSGAQFELEILVNDFAMVKRAEARIHAAHLGLRAAAEAPKRKRRSAA